MNDPSGQGKADEIEAIFNGALGFARAERAAYMSGACGDDLELRRRVEALLGAHDEAEGFLPEQPVATRVVASATMAVSEKPGDRVGRYKILQQIGEGGWGVVYMAEQQEPVRRRVALKVIKLGMDTRSVIARFEAERQALAMMDHPNIAKVLDVGATDTGRPYFVMELVRGIKITEYCDQHNLSTSERLTLFVQVCHAIQHAHQKGIIHRDIKPSNILVTLHDGFPVPKVIDFGIAKATDLRLTDKTVFTAFEQFIGTPAYMSPEQAEMSSLDIDTRSDVYSLGVLLYELLTGRTPFAAKDLLAAGMEAMRRTIREAEPLKPSTRLSTLQDADLTAVAKHRHTDPAKLTNLLRGDLDWIVMKALEKDRTRRYETASGFAQDIKRHLSSEPVAARPPSTAYKVEKFVHRHKGKMAFASALAVAVVVSVIAQTVNLVRAKRAETAARNAVQEQARLRQVADQARQRAEANERMAKAEASKSEQVAEFLKDMLKGARASVALGRDTTMLREILDKTAERVGRDLKGQPEIEAQLRETIGETYQTLFLLPQAEAMHREALRLRTSIFGTNHLAVASSLENISAALYPWINSNPVEVERLLRQALATRRKIQGTEHPDLVLPLNLLARLRMAEEDISGAESHYREALAIGRRLIGDENLAVASSLNGLAFILNLRRDFAGAEAKVRQALAINRKLLGESHPDVVDGLEYLATLIHEQGDFTAAEPLYQQSADAQKKLHGETHPFTVNARAKLGTFYAAWGRSPQAEPLWRSLIGADLWGSLALSSLEGILATPTLVPLVPDGERSPALWRYTYSAPPTNWFSPTFPDKDWQSGAALFGDTHYYPRTEWKEGTNIWLRREFGLAEEISSQTIVFRAKYDDQVEIFLNGVAAARGDRWTAGGYWLLSCSRDARNTLRPGRNVLAVHCRNLRLNGCVDVGFYLAPNLRSVRLQLAGLVGESLRENPRNPNLLLSRAGLSIQCGEWKAAAADLAESIALDPANHVFYQVLAPLLLQNGDVESYNHCRHEILERFGGTDDPVVADRMAKASLLRPLSGPDLQTVTRMVNVALAANSNHWAWTYFLFCQGLKEFRQGHLDGSLKTLADVLRREGNDSGRDLAAYAVVALAQHHLQNPNEARAALVKGRRIAETKLPRLDSGELGLGGNAHDVLIGHILLREAGAFIDDGANTKSP